MLALSSCRQAFSAAPPVDRDAPVSGWAGGAALICLLQLMLPQLAKHWPNCSSAQYVAMHGSMLRRPNEQFGPYFALHLRLPRADYLCLLHETEPWMFEPSS